MPRARLDAFVPPPPAGRRAEVLGALAAALLNVRPEVRVVVALDGVDGAGKTVLARELAALVGPFGAGEPWVRAVHDVESESAVDAVPEAAAGPDAVLLVDEIFLHRRELADLWDASVWVDTPFEVSVPRGNARFGAVSAEAADPASEVNARYVGGQRLYLAEVDPAWRATWVLDNTDLDAPVLTGTAPGHAGRPATSG